MEVGDDVVDNFEFVAGGDENIGFAGEGVENAVVISGGFKQTQRGGADGNDFLPAALARLTTSQAS